MLLAGSSLLTLLDDIATLLDDISVMGKLAAKTVWVTKRVFLLLIH